MTFAMLELLLSGAERRCRGGVAITLYAVKQPPQTHLKMLGHVQFGTLQRTRLFNDEAELRTLLEGLAKDGR
jgi:hypothetical protein